MTFKMQCSNNPLFLRRRELGKNGYAIPDIGQLLITHLFDLASENNVASFDTNFSADFSCDDFIIPRQNFDVNTLVSQSANCLTRTILRRIQESDIPD